MNPTHAPAIQTCQPYLPVLLCSDNLHIRPCCFVTGYCCYYPSWDHQGLCPWPWLSEWPPPWVWVLLHSLSPEHRVLTCAQPLTNPSGMFLLVFVSIPFSLQLKPVQEIWWGKRPFITYLPTFLFLPLQRLPSLESHLLVTGQKPPGLGLEQTDIGQGEWAAWRRMRVVHSNQS